jgi:hypothetical protein
MKILLIGIVVVAVIAGGFFYYTKVAGASIGNLNIYEGTVDVIRGGSASAGKTGTGIHKTDVIKVGPGSRVSIILKDGSVIRLEANSEVEVTELTYDGDNIQTANFRLISGKMWSKVEPLDADANWRVETPTIVASVRGTQFNTRYSDNSSGVSVYGGKVGVALLKDLSKEKLLIKDNQFILADDNLDADFAKDPIIMDSSQYDDWIIFNLGEDEKLAKQNTENLAAVGASGIHPTPTPDSSSTTPPVRESQSTSTNNPPIIPEPTAPTPQTETGSAITNTPQTEVKPTVEPPVIRRRGSAPSGGGGSSPAPAPSPVPEPVPEPEPEEVPAKTLQRIALTYVVGEWTFVQESEAWIPPTVQFSATGHYSDQSTEDITSLVSWSVEAPTEGQSAGGTIDSSGLYSPVTTGTSTITAILENITASENITISPRQLIITDQSFQ